MRGDSGSFILRRNALKRGSSQYSSSRARQRFPQAQRPSACRLVQAIRTQGRARRGTHRSGPRTTHRYPPNARSALSASSASALRPAACRKTGSNKTRSPSSVFAAPKPERLRFTLRQQRLAEVARAHAEVWRQFQLLSVHMLRRQRIDLRGNRTSEVPRRERVRTDHARAPSEVPLRVVPTTERIESIPAASM